MPGYLRFPHLRGDTLVFVASGKARPLRGEYGHLMLSRKVPRQSGHDDAAAAAKRRVFVVAKKDAHQRQPSKFYACSPSGELRLVLTNLPGRSGVPL